VAAIRQRSTSFHWLQSSWIGAVNAIELVVGVHVPSHSVNCTWLRLLILMLHEGDGVSGGIADRGMSSCGASCSVAHTQNNHDNLQEATRAAFKRAHMCIANAGDHFEQKAAYSTSPLHVKYDHITRNRVLWVYDLRWCNILHSE